MIQEILIGVIFLLALGYVGSLIYKSFHAKHACSTGCGKCAAVDLKKMEDQVESRV